MTIKHELLANGINARVRPWTAIGNYITPTSNPKDADVWVVEVCKIESYSDGKCYMAWNPYEQLEDRDQASRVLQQVLASLPPRKALQETATPQAGDLVMLEAAGFASGALGLIEGLWGQVPTELTVNFQPDKLWILPGQAGDMVVGTGGYQYLISAAQLVDTGEVVYESFTHGFPSPNEGRNEQKPARLYLLRADIEVPATARLVA